MGAAVRGDGPTGKDGKGAAAGVEVLGLNGVAAGCGVGRTTVVPVETQESKCSLMRKAATEAPQMGHAQKRLSDAPDSPDGCLRGAKGGGVAERFGMAQEAALS